MATGHPVDEHGRVLPDCDWPAEKAAPGELEVVRRFCNTCNRENGADRLATTEGLNEWLGSQNLDPIPADQADLERLVALRELIRAEAINHSSRATTTPHDLASAVGDLSFNIVVRAGMLDLDVDTTDAAERFIGTVVLIVLRAQHSGTWNRLKACRHCRWVVYDHSKNRSGFWCSMNACGGRSKVRAYRQRHQT